MFAQERWCASAARVVRSKRCDRPGGLVAPYAIVAADRRDAAEVGGAKAVSAQYRHMA